MSPFVEYICGLKNMVIIKKICKMCATSTKSHFTTYASTRFVYGLYLFSSNWPLHGSWRFLQQEQEQKTLTIGKIIAKAKADENSTIWHKERRCFTNEKDTVSRLTMYWSEVQLPHQRRYIRSSQPKILSCNCTIFCD